MLKNLNDNSIDNVYVDNVEDKHHFSYEDNQQFRCEIDITENGLFLIRNADSYVLELNLCNYGYAKIISAEGVLNLDIKVVDFIENDDILVMRYIISDEEREIRIIYRS